MFQIEAGEHQFDESLKDETIAMVLYRDKGLARSQQMFTDLNKHAVNTSKSLNTLYDSKDPMAVMTKQVVAQVPFLRKYTYFNFRSTYLKNRPGSALQHSLVY